MAKPLFIEILDYLFQNNGKFPEQYKPLAKALKDELIIWKLKESDGQLTAAASDACACYYQDYLRMHEGAWYSRLFWTLFYRLLESADVERLSDCIKRVEKIRRRLMPE